MYTLPTGRIVNSLKNWPVSYPETQPESAASILVIDPAQHANPERAAEAAHRMSFRW